METSRLDRIEKSIAELVEADEKRSAEFRLEMKASREEFRKAMKAREEADEKRSAEFRLEMKASREEFRLEMKASREEFRLEMKARDERFEKRAEKIDEVGRLLGSMGISQGDYAEELFYRSFEDNPVLGGVEFDEVERRVQIRRDRTDYDIVLKNGDSVGIVEVKYKARPEEVEALAERKIREFRRDFPDCGSRKIYFGVASPSTSPELERKARESGIFLLTREGNQVKVVNDEVRTF